MKRAAIVQNNELWRGRTKEEDMEAIRSLKLLEGSSVPEEKYLKCIYAVSNHAEEHYREVYIPKRRGSRRKLLIPDYLLHVMQTNILKKILNTGKISHYATAYHPGAKLCENALPHVGAKKILKLDIKDFFESITYIMVYNYAFPKEYFSPAVRTLLSHLCCYKDSLPQGAPTSPMISNLVLCSFDEYMGKWCGERGIHYTRYCDDMTFSGEFDTGEVRDKVRSYLQVLGFELNRKKTKVLGKHGRQSVTGIVVNEKPQVSKEYRRNVRQAVYYCEKYGVRGHLERIEDAERLKAGEENYLRHLSGKVNHILQVNPKDRSFLEIQEKLNHMRKRYEAVR